MCKNKNLQVVWDLLTFAFINHFIILAQRGGQAPRRWGPWQSQRLAGRMANANVLGSFTGRKFWVCTVTVGDNIVYLTHCGSPVTLENFPGQASPIGSLIPPLVPPLQGCTARVRIRTPIRARICLLLDSKMAQDRRLWNREWSVKGGH